MVFYEKTNSRMRSIPSTARCVGYPDVVNSAIDPAGSSAFHLTAAFTFKEQNLLEKCCVDYLQLGSAASDYARLRARPGCTDAFLSLRYAELEINLEQARKRPQVIILAGPVPYRPAYQPQIPEALAGMGDVITEDAVPPGACESCDRWC